MAQAQEDSVLMRPLGEAAPADITTLLAAAMHLWEVKLIYLNNFRKMELGNIDVFSL